MDDMWMQRKMDDMWTPKKQMDDMWAEHEILQYMGVSDMSDNRDYRSTADSFAEDDEHDYEEDSEYDDDAGIDNTDLSYHGRKICIELNDSTRDLKRKKNGLQKSEHVLCEKYPKLKEMQADTRLQNLLDGIFPEGFNKQMYVRNLTFTKQGSEHKILAIRPERTKGDFMDTMFPKGVSLLFKGHPAGKQFVVDSIHETTDTEQLDFEADVIATPYTNPSMIGSNFLYDIIKDAESLTEYTEERLEEWNEYISWKQQLAKRQIYGCKYYKITFDEDKKQLIFWLVCENKETFQAFKKYLWRDIQVFDNNYSTDKWHFVFSGATDGNRRHRRYNSIELGRCKGIRDEYYLKDNSEDDEQQGIFDGRVAEYIEGDYEDDLYSDFADEESETDDTNISDVFENPYIVKVAYELNQNDMDEINRRNLDDDGMIQYVRDYVIGNYYPNGFLALSAIGEFVLLNRFSQAIGYLERDECYSPNLAMWLFNISRARLPQAGEHVEIDTWLNSKIKQNENQRQAVYKMLDAPDICLIQGPPGTGKTTVIAEAIYQFVKRGNRVLVASQSNDAVDNALERLADTPVIRAIRLGQKGRRTHRGENLETRKFSEDEALKYYYSALSQQVTHTWLDIWDRLESVGAQYDIDIREAKLYNSDISELNKILEKQNQQYDAARADYNDLNEKIKKANDANTTIQNDKIQFKLLIDHYNGVSDEKYFLSKSMLRHIEKALNPLIGGANQHGVYLMREILNVDILGTHKECANIYSVIMNLSVIKKLKEKVINTSGSSGESDSEIIILKSKMSQAKEKMCEAIINEDQDEELKYKNLVKSLQKQIEKISGKSSYVSVTQMEKDILADSFIEMITGADKDRALKVIDCVVEIRYNIFRKL